MKWLLALAIAGLWVVSLVYVYGIGALAGRYVPQTAESAMARSAPVVGLFLGEFQPCGGANPLNCGFRDASDRVEVDCGNYQSPRTAVLVTFGQSNSANAGNDRYIPVGDVANFNFHNGKCYRAEDPLLGPDGSGGSVWGVLGDKLIAGGHYDRVLIAPFGIGGSSLGQWQNGAYLFPILEKAAAAIVERGITPTHVLWHQGEADAEAGTAEQEYSAMFRALLEQLRALGIGAPVYPAVATHCQMPFVEPDPGRAARSAAVRAAQSALPSLAGVFAGPDTDTIQGVRYRHDNCHFNAQGMQAHANLWLQAILQMDPNSNNERRL